MRKVLGGLAFVLLAASPVWAQAPATAAVIGPATPCVAMWNMGSYTGSLTEYDIYIDIPAPTPTTGPTRTVVGPNLPTAPPYAITWPICQNLPNLSAGPHTISVAAKNAAGIGPVSVTVPFVFEIPGPPPAPSFSSPPVL